MTSITSIPGDSHLMYIKITSANIGESIDVNGWQGAMNQSGLYLGQIMMYIPAAPASHVYYLRMSGLQTASNVQYAINALPIFMNEGLSAAISVINANDMYMGPTARFEAMEFDILDNNGTRISDSNYELHLIFRMKRQSS